MRDIDVYGFIGKDYWDEDAVSAKQFLDQLRDAGGDDVTIHINSGGGDVFEAQAMSEAIRAYRGRVTASVEGIAASAASFFALTADEVVMNPSALLMIHNPYSYAMGDAREMRETADLLDKVRGTMTRLYNSKTGIDASDIEAMLDAETWLDADEALEKGFVDRLTDEPPVVACVSDRMLARFRNAPRSLVAGAGEPRSTMHPSDGGAGAEGEAPEAVVEAMTRVICVNGQFLNA